MINQIYDKFHDPRIETNDYTLLKYTPDESKIQGTQNHDHMLLSIILLFTFRTLSAELKPKERNILASEAKAIDLARVLVTDNSWIKLPDYKNRLFWQNLPGRNKTGIYYRKQKIISNMTGLL